MKKLIPIIIFFLVKADIKAQVDYKISVLAGIGGANTVSIFKPEHSLDEKNAIIPSFSYQAGVGSSISFDRRSIHLDISYIRKANNHYRFTGTTLPSDDYTLYKYSFNYLIVPVYYQKTKNNWLYNIGIVNNFALEHIKGPLPDVYYLKNYHPGIILGTGIKLNDKMNIELNALADIKAYNYVVYNYNEKGGYRFAYNVMVSVQYNVFSLD